MFIQKNTKTINFKKAISFFIGLSLLSANCLNPLNNKVSAMENEGSKENKKTSSFTGESKPLVAPLKNNENQLPLNEGTNGGGNGGQENLQNVNENFQASNKEINKDSQSNQVNNEENQNLADQNQIDFQNANSSSFTKNEPYLKNEIMPQTTKKDNKNEKKSILKTNELPDEGSIYKYKITCSIDGENLKFEDVFDYAKEKNDTIFIHGVKENCRNLIKEVFFSNPLNINNPQKRLTKINHRTFSRCKKLEKITIPDSVSEIKYDTFGKCKELKTVILPDFKIKSIGKFAFHGCVKLKNINFPNSIFRIEEFAFKSCVSLSTIILPKTLIIIDDSAFKDCVKLTFIFPEHLKFVGPDAFANCENFKNPEIPNSVIMSQGSFRGCDNLLKIIKNQLRRDYENIFELCNK
ncbi:MAG: leucine-rich repeat domain-containing protein [Oscillospiraceae bacterium]|jgi:hypothetical protein|nr:leucine-rich repeat domain-containing protein [Oscillospiraceae bacterium]